MVPEVGVDRGMCGISIAIGIGIALHISGASSATLVPADCAIKLPGDGKGGAKRGRGARHCKLLQWPQLRRNSLRFSFRLFMFLSRCGFYERRCQLISSPLHSHSSHTLLALPQRSQFVKQLMPDGATVHRRHRVNKTITDFL